MVNLCIRYVCRCCIYVFFIYIIIALLRTVYQNGLKHLRIYITNTTMHVVFNNGKMFKMFDCGSASIENT